jgi:formylglycine-generating enzyme required for sulfatase activity
MDSNPSPEHFPHRLAELGFLGRVIHGVEVIMPPVCLVPGGPFLMGSDPSHNQAARDDEQPQQWVTLPELQVARYPVTVAEYACFVRTGHAEPKSRSNILTWQQQCERPDHPVVNVSWYDATSYATWLVQVTGLAWKLPSEAEWEKAASWDPKTRTAHIYPWGDTFKKALCNNWLSGIGTTTPVGTYPRGASPCGAQDMAGNVWEWTSTLYTPYPYQEADGRENPYAPGTGMRVQRGGCWFDVPKVRAAFRHPWLPLNSHFVIGFRMVQASSSS